MMMVIKIMPHKKFQTKCKAMYLAWYLSSAKLSHKIHYHIFSVS